MPNTFNLIKQLEDMGILSKCVKAGVIDPEVKNYYLIAKAYREKRGRKMKSGKAIKELTEEQRTSERTIYRALTFCRATGRD